MKNNKKLIIGGSIILIAVFIIGTGFLTHDGPPGSWGRGFHHRFHGKGFSKHVLERMDSKVEKLNLTDAQNEKYQEIRSRVEEEISEMRNNRMEFFIGIKEEMNNDTPDIEKIAGLMKGKLEQMPAKISAHLDQFVEFYNILDEEQKAQIIQRFRAKMSRYPFNKFSNEAGDEQEEK